MPLLNAPQFHHSTSSVRWGCHLCQCSQKQRRAASWSWVSFDPAPKQGEPAMTGQSGTCSKWEITQKPPVKMTLIQRGARKTLRCVAKNCWFSLLEQVRQGENESTNQADAYNCLKWMDVPRISNTGPSCRSVPYARLTLRIPNRNPNQAIGAANSARVSTWSNWGKRDA